jgi:hypothetical protein
MEKITLIEHLFFVYFLNNFEETGNLPTKINAKSPLILFKNRQKMPK